MSYERQYPQSPAYGRQHPLQLSQAVDRADRQEWCLSVRGESPARSITFDISAPAELKEPYSTIFSSTFSKAA
jgi:hypothetical protein